MRFVVLSLLNVQLVVKSVDLSFLIINTLIRSLFASFVFFYFISQPRSSICSLGVLMRRLHVLRWHFFAGTLGNIITPLLPYLFDILPKLVDDNVLLVDVVVFVVN